MKIRTYYEASDGKIFYDKQACEEHEAFLKERFPAQFFSGSGALEEVSSIKEAGFLVIYRKDFLDLVEDEKERKNLETEIEWVFLPCLLIRREDGKWQRAQSYLYEKRDECAYLEDAIETVKRKY